MRQIYLVQRGVIQPKFKPEMRLSETVRLDYMGSSEFEWGALPKSLRRMQEVGTLQSVVFRTFSSRTGSPLRACGVFKDAGAYESALAPVIAGTARTKEFTGFDQHVGPETKWSTGVDFWWDIENDVMMSFHKKFMKTLPEILGSSWAWMDAQKT